MNRILLTSLVLGLLVSPAAAQQRQRFQGGERQPPGAGGWSGGGWFDRLLGRVVNELGLDDEQRAQLEDIAEPHRQGVQEMSQRWQEMREARRNGDEERAAELRAQMSAARGPSGVMARLLEDVEPILHDDQLERFYDIQDRMETQQRRAEIGRRVFSELPDELGLDETQRAEWDRLMQAQRERRRERFGAMRPTWEEMREADAAGDEERAQELRKQIEQMRSDSDEMLGSFFNELEKILREDQLPILEKYRQEFGIGVARDRDHVPDVRTILRAAKRVRLDSAQRETLREIERDVAKERREIDRRDTAAQQKFAKTVKRQIVKILDSEQARAFEKQLERLDRRYRGPDDRAPERKP